MSAHDDGDALVIGLVNNMPDGAFKTTERQFRELLTFARGDTPIRLRLFSLPEAGARRSNPRLHHGQLREIQPICGRPASTA